MTDEQYRPQSVEQLARELGIAAEELDELQATVESLHRSGRVLIGEHNTVLPPETSGRVIGTYRGHPRGFGFITPESPVARGDLFVPAGRQMSAITGDIVLARVIKKGKRGGRMILEGRVIRILQRGQSRFVGRVQHAGQRWLMIPEGRTLNVPVFLPDAESRAVGPDCQVVVELVQYPAPDQDATGVIVEILGRHGEPEVECQSMIRQYHLPHEFSEACLQQAREATQRFDVRHLPDDREDLQDRVIITIDPDDARDFDDAISLRRLPDGWELGVHIADVSHFVPPDSPLDLEARRRGNSVYFPRHVLPMLPEVLSNGVCSLQEHVPRLTKSVFIHYDAEGRVRHRRFGNTIIRSARRLTYRQATLILDGRTGTFEPAVVDLLRNMEHLARTVQQRRRDDGMLSLELPGVELILDDDGAVIDVAAEDHSFSHTIIEMFMIEANEAVAELLTHRRLPHLRRIHLPPKPHALEQAADFVRIVGYRLPLEAQPRDIQKVLDQASGTPEAFSVNLAILKSFQQAEYSPHLVGHYALASPHYSHFTSPIRRYPDLTVHRLLDLHLRGQLLDDRPNPEVPDVNVLRSLGAHCSFTERRAEDAERELKLVRILRLLTAHLGMTCKGVISGVTDFGVFVQIDNYLVEGLIPIEHLPDDVWETVHQAGCLLGRRSGRRLTLGDRVAVSISRINVPQRKLELALTKQLSTRGRGAVAGPAAGRKRTTARRRQAGRRSARNPRKRRRGRR